MDITFHRSGQPYINAGIIGVHAYMQRAKQAQQDAEHNGDYSPEDEWVKLLPKHTFELLSDRLCITTEKPITLLEELYYAMGRDHYGTSTRKALQKLENAYYDEKGDTFRRFPAKSTYGFGHLLTNNAAPKMRDDGNLFSRSKPEKLSPKQLQIVAKAVQYFGEQDIKLQQQIYLNEPYVKITRLELTEADFMPGKTQCPITGEGFRRLQEATNISPTASGIINFMSGIGTKGAKVGWKALYLIRFVPTLAFYRYTNGMDKLFTYVYDTGDLVSLKHLFKTWNRIKLPEPEKQRIDHLANFRLTPIYNKNANAASGSTDFVLPNEMLFHLIYTINYETTKKGSATDTDTALFADDRTQQIAFYTVTASKKLVGKTLRPITIQHFTHFDRTQRIIRLGRQIEGFDWKKLLGTLPLRKTNYSKQNAFEMSRVTRDTVLYKLMYGQDFTAELARFAYDCYGLRLAGENIGYKSFKQLALFIEHFILKPNPTIIMDQQHKLTPEVRVKAYNLGTSIGEQIMRHGDSTDTPSSRAKAGRKYTVQLNKARNYNDFLAAIVRLTIRFEGLVPSKDLLQSMLTEDNYESVKHLTVLGAMTRINSKLSRESAEGKKAETQNA